MEFDGIPKSVFVNAAKIESRELTYEMLSLIREDQKKLIKRKTWDTTFSGFMGLVGGAIALFIQTLLFKKIG